MKEVALLLFIAAVLLKIVLHYPLVGVMTEQSEIIP